MEEDYLPAQMSNSQQKMLYGGGGLFGIFVLIAIILMIVEGLGNANWLLMAIGLMVFLGTAFMLIRWVKDGGVPDNADHLKYMTFGTVIALILFSIGGIFLMYQTPLRCDRITISGGTSSCPGSGDDKLGPIADGTATCVLSCNPGFGFPDDPAAPTSYTFTQSLKCQEDGTYDSVPKGQCQMTQCPALGAPTTGIVMTPPTWATAMAPSDGTAIVGYSCNNGQALEPPTATVQVCMMNGMWSGQTPTCGR